MVFGSFSYDLFVIRVDKLYIYLIEVYSRLCCIGWDVLIRFLSVSFLKRFRFNIWRVCFFCFDVNENNYNI